MPDSSFLQIHTLTSYPASLLNRDDAGFAKRMPFGGTSRIRISSQCLKRHWRTFDGEASWRRIETDAEPSIRSRLTFERYVLAPLVDSGVDREIAQAVVSALMSEVLGESAKAKATKKDDEDAGVRTGQITILGHPEVRFILELAKTTAARLENPKDLKKVVKEVLDKDQKRNLKALRHSAGIDAALFGRMVTSDILAREDAAIHVAHALTVHEEEAETDYFSAVDDLLADSEEGGLGSGHINNQELTSGLFYGYVVVDIPLLVSNLEGCERGGWREANRELAGEVIQRLVQLVATVSPGAKLGSTAPYAYASLVLLEYGTAQPRTLANAFLRPVDIRPNPLAAAYGALDSHIAEFDSMYGASGERRGAAMGPKDLLSNAIEATASVSDIATWARDKVLA